jgi:hypothetical protein
MPKSVRPLTAALAAAALVAVPATASAAPSGDPGTARKATPSHACDAVLATLAQFGVDAGGLDRAACLEELSGRPSELEVSSGKPYEQCQALEQGVETPGGTFRISYPYTFHAGEGDPLPDLVAANRGQCARALWAYHTIEEHLPVPPDAA